MPLLRSAESLPPAQNNRTRRIKPPPPTFHGQDWCCAILADEFGVSEGHPKLLLAPPPALVPGLGGGSSKIWRMGVFSACQTQATPVSRSPVFRLTAPPLLRKTESMSASFFGRGFRLDSDLTRYQNLARRIVWAICRVLSFSDRTGDGACQHDSRHPVSTAGARFQFHQRRS